MTIELVWGLSDQPVSYHSQLSIVIYQLSIYYEENPSRLNCHSGFYHSFFFAYFFPADIEGRILFQHDTVAGVGAGQEAQEYLERTGERTRWTNSILAACLPIRCLRVTIQQKTSEVGGKGLSVCTFRLCRADFHYDAGLLYPSASIRVISLAG